VKLGEVAKIIRGVSFSKEERSLKWFKGGIPILRANNIKENGTLDLNDLMYVIDSKISDEQKLQIDDIVVVASSGNKQLVGKNVRINKIDQVLSFGAFMYCIRPKTIDPRYLYLFFHSSSYRIQLREIVEGTNINNLRKSDLANIELLIPEDINEQRRIADILSAFDDKIELNNKIIKTLEEMAQEVFKEWFVRFRFPGWQKVKFVDSELGKIPEGWEVKNIMEIVKRIPVGKRYDNKNALPKGKVPILDQGQSGIIGFHNEEPGVKASPQNPVAVFSNHTCYYRLVTFDFSCIQNVIPYIGINGYPTTFVFYLTKDKIKMSDYKGHWPEFTSQKFIVPPPELAAKFNETIQPMIEKIDEIRKENQKLAALRDLLLPKLISGEIRV
jgi:type I restriction enzyme S subunit